MSGQHTPVKGDYLQVGRSILIKTPLHNCGMFRWQENEFLTKSDYSRNCLTFEEEEQQAAALLSSTKPQHVEKCKLANKVYISAGGMCTEPFVKAFLSGTNGLVWKETALGVLGMHKYIYICR